MIIMRIVWIGVFSLLLSFPVLAQTNEVPSTQLADLDAQAQKLITEYADQKKQIEVDLQAQLSSLGNTPDERLQRKKLMLEAKRAQRELQDNFKVNMDSIREAQNSIAKPRDMSAPPLVPEKVRPPSRPPEIFRAPREGEVSIAERIRQQDERLGLPPQERPSKSPGLTPPTPSETAPGAEKPAPAKKLTNEEIKAKYDKANKDIKRKYGSKRWDPEKHNSLDNDDDKEDKPTSSLNTRKKHVYKTRLNKKPRRNY